MKAGSRSRGATKKETKEVLKPVDDRLEFMYSLYYIDCIAYVSDIYIGLSLCCLYLTRWVTVELHLYTCQILAMPRYKFVEEWIVFVNQCISSLRRVGKRKAAPAPKTDKRTAKKDKKAKKDPNKPKRPPSAFFVFL